MKKILSILICLIFTANIVCAKEAFAQEAFLSLTKYSEPVEKLPTNITIISSEDIENKHVETLGELLENEVGIFYKTNGTTGDMPTVFMRGSAASARTLVLIDGRRVNDAGAGAANFAAIPVSMIERVEIIRGAGSAVYGTGAFGGVINVITKTAKEDSPAAEFGASYGSFRTWNPYAALPYYDEKVALMFAGSMYQTDGYRTNSDYKSSNIFFNGSVNLAENSYLSLSANSYDANFGYPGSKVWKDPGRRKDQNTYAKADYNLKIGDKNLTVSAYTSKNTSFNESTYGGSKETNYTLGTQADFKWNFILFGAEFWREFYKNENTVSAGMPAGTVNNENRDTAAAYVQGDIDIKSLKIIPSFRYDNNSVYGDVWTPSISAVFNINEVFKISANSGKVWRAPSFMDLYSQWGANPDLDAEEGVSSDFGIEFSKNKIRLAATGYYITSDNLIVSDFNTGYIPKNVDKANQYGIEFEAGQIITSWINHKVNYTYLKAENDSKEYKDNILPFSPENSVNYTLNIKPLTDLSLSAVLSYKDKYYEDMSNMQKADGFTTLDLNVNYKMSDKISFWIKGFNIGNADYQIVNGYPMSGVTVYGGIDIKLWK